MHCMSISSSAYVRMPPSSTTTDGAIHHTAAASIMLQPLQHVLAMEPRRRWRNSLASGLRAALACTIVGVASVYSPPAIRRHLTFPAFSYVVTVIIVTDATLGSALRAALSALHATAMGAVPSVLPLWLAHRTGVRESMLATTAVVALSTLAVALPDSAGPMAKRIALGQIIIIYVARFREGSMQSEPVLLHPANVVACTALGVAAALLAVLLPCPRLAEREVRDKRAAYLEVAAERVRLLANALQLTMCNDDEDDVARASSSLCRRRRRLCIMSQAERAASASAALLRRIISAQGDSQWERMLKRWCCASTWDDDGDDDPVQLHDCIEMPLRGMEMAVLCTSGNKQQQTLQGSIWTSTWLRQATDQVRLALLTQQSRRGKGEMPKLAPPAPHMLGDEEPNQLSPFVFLLCMDLVLHGSPPHPLPEHNPKLPPPHCGSNVIKVMPAANEDQEQSPEKKKKKKHPWLWLQETTTRRQLLSAAKCAFSLGLAVLLGLLFSSDHGFWSGLIVATTMATGREWTWALAVARAHGTALGSVYGVLACLLIDQRHLMELRFLALLPWLVLTSGFLKRSRAYGPAGGVAAAVSGIIIVGRRYNEPAMAFTVARLVETFIGLACTVLADLVFQPAARPSAKAMAQLTRCLGALTECFSDSSARQTTKVKALQDQVALLERYVAEAAGEPNFLWSEPFPMRCYEKVAGSLGRMVLLLYLYKKALAEMQHPIPADEAAEDAMQSFHGIVSASLDRCGALLVLLLHEEEEQPQEENDLEAGIRLSSSGGCCDEAEAPEMVVRSFLGHANETMLQQQRGDPGGATPRCLASIGFCMGEMAKEALHLEAQLLDLTLHLSLRSSLPPQITIL